MAGEVVFAWGVNGWASVSGKNRPSGTVLDERGIMHSPMARQENGFAIKLEIPSGTRINYGFLITKKRDGSAIPAIWDGHDRYYNEVKYDEIVQVKPILMLSQWVQLLPGAVDISLRILLGIGSVLTLWLIFIRMFRGHTSQIISLLLISLTFLGLILPIWMTSTAFQILKAPLRLIVDESGNKMQGETD